MVRNISPRWLLVLEIFISIRNICRDQRVCYYWFVRMFGFGLFLVRQEFEVAVQAFVVRCFAL